MLKSEKNTIIIIPCFNKLNKIDYNLQVDFLTGGNYSSKYEPEEDILIGFIGLVSEQKILREISITK